MDTCRSLSVACEHFVSAVAPPITAILGATTDRLVTCQEDLHWIWSHASVTNVLAAGWFISILAIWYYIRQVRVDIRQLHAHMDLQESQLTRGSGSENTLSRGRLMVILWDNRMAASCSQHEEQTPTRNFRSTELR